MVSHWLSCQHSGVIGGILTTICGQMDGHDRSHAPRVDMFRVIMMTTGLLTLLPSPRCHHLLTGDTTAEGLGVLDI